jgi:hypothetical protein
VIPVAAAVFAGGMFTNIGTEVEYRHDMSMDIQLVLTDHLQTFHCCSQERDSVINPYNFNIIFCAPYITSSGLKSYTFYVFALYTLLPSLGTLLFYPQHRRFFYKFLRFQSRSMQECKRAELLELFLYLHLSHRTAALTSHSTPTNTI